jgi:hypothetical protein
MMLFISTLPHCIQMAANCRPSLDILAAEFNNKSKEDCRSLRVIQSGSKGRMSQPQATSGASEVSSSCSPLRSAVPHMVAPQKSTNHNTIHNIPQHSTTSFVIFVQPCSPAALQFCSDGFGGKTRSSNGLSFSSGINSSLGRPKVGAPLISRRTSAGSCWKMLKPGTTCTVL